MFLDPLAALTTLNSHFKEHREVFKVSNLPQVQRIQDVIQVALSQMKTPSDFLKLDDIGVQLAENIKPLLISEPALLCRTEIKTLMKAFSIIGALSDERLNEIFLACLQNEHPLDQCKALVEACSYLMGSVASNSALVKQIIDISKREGDWNFLKDILSHPSCNHEEFRIDHKPCWEILVECEQYEIAASTLQLLNERSWPLDSQGRSPQHYAAETNNVAFAISLQELMADFTLLDSAGCTPLERAILNGSEMMATFLGDQMNLKPNPESVVLKQFLAEAAAQNNFLKVTFLIQLGVSPKGIVVQGRELIHFFIKEGQWEAVDIVFKYLLLDFITEKPLELITELTKHSQWEILEKIFGSEHLPNIDSIQIDDKHLVDFLVEQKQWGILLKIYQANFSEILSSGGSRFLVNPQLVSIESLVLGALKAEQFELCLFLVDLIFIESVDFAGKKIYQHFIEKNIDSGVYKCVESLLRRRGVALRRNENITQIDRALQEIIASLIETNNWEIIKNCIDQFGFKRNLNPLLEEMKIHGHPLIYHAMRSERAYEIGIRTFAKGVHLSQKEAEELVIIAKQKKEFQLIAFVLFNCDDFHFEVENKPIVSWLIENRFWDGLGILILRCEEIEDLKLNLPAILTEAKKDHNASLLKALIQKNVEVTHFEKYAGFPRLLFVLKYGLYEQLEAELSLKKDLDAVDEQGYSALHYAIKGGLSDVCRELVKAGAPLRMVDFNFEGRQDQKELAILHFLQNKQKEMQLKTIDQETKILIFLVYPELAEEYGLIGPLLKDFDVEESAKSLFLHIQGQKIGEPVKIQAVVYPQDLGGVSLDEKQRRVASACRKLREVFESFEDRDLEGIKSSEEVVISPHKQRDNLAYFLQISEHKTKITGVGENRDDSYESIRNTVEHLALIINDLPKEDQISYLSRYSTIDVGYCIDPYKGASSLIYSSVRSQSFEKMHQMQADHLKLKSSQGAEGPPIVLEMELVQDGPIEIQDPGMKFQKEVFVCLAAARDQTLRDVLHVSEAVIDTHAVNWVYRHFGPEIGTSFIGQDAFLEEHGRVMLALFLDLSHIEETLFSETGLTKAEAITLYHAVIAKRYWDYSKLALLNHFNRFIQEKFAENSEQIIDFYHYLVDLDKSSKLEALKARFGEFEHLDERIALRNRNKKLTSTLKQFDSKLKECEANQALFEKKVSTLRIEIETLSEGQLDKKAKLELRLEGAESQLLEYNMQIENLNGKIQQAQKELREVATLEERYSTDFSKLLAELEQIDARAKADHGRFSQECIDFKEEPSFSAYIRQEGVFLLFKLTLKYLRTNFS